jgi:hypothetical protein
MLSWERACTQVAIQDVTVEMGALGNTIAVVGVMQPTRT